MSAFSLVKSPTNLKIYLHRYTQRFATRINSPKFRLNSLEPRFIDGFMPSCSNTKQLRFMRWHTFFKRCSLLKLLLSLEDIKTLYTLSYYLKTLTFDLGCCPFDNESSHSLSDCCIKTFIIRSYVGLDKFRKTLAATLYSTHEIINTTLYLNRFRE